MDNARDQRLTWMTCVVDGQEHAVDEDESGKPQHSGVYRAICGHGVMPESLLSPPGRRCTRCSPDPDRHGASHPRTRHRRRTGGVWRWRPGRHRAGRVSTTRFVAVVGPPAVGKSTVTSALAEHCGARVFRLREFAHEIRGRPGVDQGLFVTDDPLGWLAEDTVAVLLRAAFEHERFPTSALVVLENLPGSLAQLRLIASITDRLRAPLTLVELTAGDDLLTARSQARRVCPTCDPDPRGDPHRPARAGRDDPDRCAGCGGALCPRGGDEPATFTARLARFRDRIPVIRAAAKNLHLPHHEVDATTDPTTCLRRVMAVLAATEPVCRRAHLPW